MSSIKLTKKSFQELRGKIEKKNYYTDVEVSDEEIKILTEGGWIVIEGEDKAEVITDIVLDYVISGGGEIMEENLEDLRKEIREVIR